MWGRVHLCCVHADNQLAWPRLLKRLFFPLWNYLNTLVKNQLPINTDSRFRSIDLYVCPYASTTAFPLPQFCGELFFFLDFIYLFLERVERKEKERERNISVWLPLTCPLVGTWPRTSDVPWLGIEPVTLWFAACTLNPLSHTSQGYAGSFEIRKCALVFFFRITVMHCLVTGRQSEKCLPRQRHHCVNLHKSWWCGLLHT